MAPIRSIETYLFSLGRMKENIQDVLNTLEYAEHVLNSGQFGSPASLENDINAILSGLSNYLGTEIVSSLTGLALNIEVWGVIASSQFMGESQRLWTSTAVDVDDGASGSTLTVNQDEAAVILTVFEIADVVTITKAEDPNHNGRYTVAAVTGTKLTFDATMLGKDNANDETMIITLVER